MMYKYGNYTNTQISETKKYMRKQIYFLLLIVDPETKSEYANVNVKQAYENTMFYFAGLNNLLKNPPELVRVMGLLESALIEYNKDTFNFKRYRKLVLDAGSEVLKIKEV